MKQLLDAHLHEIEEPLPESLLTQLGLMNRRDAFRNIHFPESFETLAKARERLVFEEFFIFELALIQKIQHERRKMRSPAMLLGKETLSQFEASLPFRMTESQQRVCREILNDLGTEVPMRRLLQGEVGSGKTVIAAFSLLLAAGNNFQGALMAPTEVLAEQHYETLVRLLAPFGLKIALLTGSIRENERSELLADLRNQRIHIAVGTHALIQESVKFANLGLVVIDEQHKFGVRQRAKLLASERKPHLLVMTATPIPRTLGLTLYGDLDISTLKELPAGRKPVKTFWIAHEKEKEILRHVREHTRDGSQAYIVFPIIDETEKADLLAATKEYERLCREDFAGLPVGLVHGRMIKSDRDTVMKNFRDRSVKILVATSVIEVGIDNPNATLMVVEHAERFGLSQLHQLRGRIGRGEKESFCFLFGEPSSDEGKRRLRILTKLQDGFAIAEEDLKLRGPGDFLGTRQSGTPFFRLADLLADAEMLRQARIEATQLLGKDPGLKNTPLLHYFVQKESLSLSPQEASRSDPKPKDSVT
ncbi:MAG TPA: ATP-dependent DNA helicase RecG, partial [Candidatus Omnitrophota bacterium]|nr:ATP-dependent DNA helicase RecG [Candidatus Omnitrophota bacterium]